MMLQKKQDGKTAVQIQTFVAMGSYLSYEP
jgi:hypothetical protein